MRALDLNDSVRYSLETLSFLAVVGVMAEVLPWVASLFTIIWVGLNIFDWGERRWKKRAEEDKAMTAREGHMTTREDKMTVREDKLNG